MQGFSSKLTTYDFLGILIPGIVIVSVIIRIFYSDCLFEQVNYICCSCKMTVENKPSFLAYLFISIMIFAASYIVGLLVNSLSDNIFGRFRNNDLHLRIALVIFRKSISNNKKKRNIGHQRTFRLFFDVICQIFGCRNRHYTPLQKEYYKIHYWLSINKRLSGAVLTLESQVAFARNMILPTLLTIISAIISKTYLCGLSLLILLFCELYIMYARQMRVYVIMYEDFYWTKKLINDEKIFNNNTIITD